MAMLLGLTRRITTSFSAFSRSLSTTRPALTGNSEKASSSAAASASASEATTPSTLPSMLAADLRVVNQLPLSLEPYMGRSIGNVSNASTAYRRLNGILFQNKIRRDLKAHIRYEKPTAERRRKKIERNRKLFGAMVRKKVALIMQMKQRGM